MSSLTPNTDEFDSWIDYMGRFIKGAHVGKLVSTVARTDISYFKYLLTHATTLGDDDISVLQAYVDRA